MTTNKDLFKIGMILFGILAILTAGYLMYREITYPEQSTEPTPIPTFMFYEIPTPPTDERIQEAGAEAGKIDRDIEVIETDISDIIEALQELDQELEGGW